MPIAGGGGFGPAGVGLDRGASGEGAVWSVLVVVAAELVEKVLEFSDRDRGMSGEPFLLGLVEALDFSAGLRMVGPRRQVFDAQCAQGYFQGGAAVTAGLSGEDGAVEFLRDVKPLRVV
jgi:hypothetical protein